MIKSRNSEVELDPNDDDQAIDSRIISADLIKRHKEDCEMKGISIESVRRYLSSINVFIQYLRGMESIY